MSEQNAFGDCENGLMKMEEDEDEPKRLTGCSVSMRAPTEEATYPDARFRDAVHADGIVVA